MTTGDVFFDRIKKTHFDHLYDLPDCRGYYQALQPLEYQIPTHTIALLRGAVGEIARLRGVQHPWLLDLASGYGVASALLRHEIDMSTLLTRYSSAELADADTDALIAADRSWYTARRHTGAQPRIAGIDISANALTYGEQVGLYDRTFTANLETRDPPPSLARFLPQVSLVLEMGGVGYIGEATFRRILHRIGEPAPWILIAPTRVSDSAPCLALFTEAGLIAERAPNAPFRHRRFTGSNERTNAITELERKGLDYRGFEDTGFYFADAYLARPPDECAMPIAALMQAGV